MRREMMKFKVVFIGVYCAAFMIFFVSGSWIAMDPSKSLTSDCLVGGYEESDNFKGSLYIGRKRIDSELTIGKVIDAWKSGYFPKDGVEHWSDTYEVFCSEKIVWIPRPKNHENFIQGGEAGNGEPFYVCRGVFDGQTIPGKFYKPTSCCYVTSYGKEHCVQDYSLMRNA